MGAPRRHARRGSLYVLVLSGALIVTLIGVSAILAVRVRQRSAAGDEDLARARLAARSAVDFALGVMDTTADWRSVRPHGVWLSAQPLGPATASLRVLDPADGDLADDRGESLEVVGLGQCGPARYQLQVTLVPPLVPLEALNTCVHAGGGITVDWLASLTAGGAPVSTNGQLRNLGYVNGDVEAASVQTIRAINGSVTAPAEPKELPAAGLFGEYVRLACVSAAPLNIAGVLFSPGSNPWGAVHPDGVYYIDTRGYDAWIEGTRVFGTLVVRTGGATLHVGRAVHFSPARPDYPALVVAGHLDVAFDSAHGLSEDVWGRNFNPSHAPYDGESDSSLGDVYPSEVRGLVYATGGVRCREDSRLRGTLLCDLTLVCDDDLTITHDPAAYATPPLHFTTYGTPVPVPGSWRQTLPPALETPEEVGEPVAPLGPPNPAP